MESRTFVSEAGRVLASGGDAGALARGTDWSKTAIGPVETWSQALRSAASLVLHNHSGMLLWWGPEFVQIYNDAYRPVLGDKHPRAMGQPFRECWSEVFDQVGPMAERPFRGGPASTSADLPLLVDRRAPREETHFQIAYSPVPDETVPETGIGGVLATVTETSEEVFGKRQMETLRDLGARSAAEGKSVTESCSAAIAALGENRWDVPFSLLYLFEGAARAHLCAQCGFAPDSPHPAAPEMVDLAADGGIWPLRKVIESRRAEVVRPSPDLPPLPATPWGFAAETAIVLPLSSPDQADPYGALVCGLSPHRSLDAGYSTFFELAAAHVVTAIRNARALEEEKKRAEALAQIDRAKTAFFSNVSHEFRTPLTLMLGPIEEAREQGEPLAGSPLETVHRNTLRLLRLVNTLLDFSRIEAQRAQPHYQSTDLAALTRDLASSFRSAIERGGLRFDVECDPLDAPVWVDCDMWEKIVLNLLSNALKFTFEGAILVRQRAAGDRVVLEVRDTGVGIPEQELPRVFERFHRIEGSRARTHEGSGIGLALVHDLVGLHGGTVDAESRPGAGTTFRVSLPFGRAHLSEERLHDPTDQASTRVGVEAYVSEALRWMPAEGPPPPAPAGAARILVADDNADMRESLARLLGATWSVETVENGTKALARAHEHPPDLIVTDVMMPGLDGFELIRRLREDPATAAVPVLVLSARAGEDARIDGLAHGADDYVVKPFSARELVARVHAQLAKSRHRAATEAERHRLRALLGQMPAIVNFLRGPDLILEYVHPLAVRTLGDRDLVGKPLLEAIPEFRDQEYPVLLRRVVETGERIEGREQRVLLSDGQGGLRETWWNFVYLPVRDAEGRIEGVMTFDLDVTDQVLARAGAEAASRAKDEFLAMLGHELRNPLSPIVTSLQILRMRGEGTREHAVIERQVDHLTRLVDDLLDVSRITRGKIELRRSRIELGHAVLRGLEIASPLLETRQQRLVLSIPQTGLAVDGDLDRLAQVVANLLSNAAKYSEPGTEVTLRAQRAGDRVRLSVRDAGIGMEPELVPRVFDMFFQQPQALDRSKGGLGLGLAIVRSLVEMHGGSVRAASAGPGKGSEFTVDLPLARMRRRASDRPGPRSMPASRSSSGWPVGAGTCCWSTTTSTPPRAAPRRCAGWATSCAPPSTARRRCARSRSSRRRSACSTSDSRAWTATISRAACGPRRACRRRRGSSRSPATASRVTSCDRARPGSPSTS